MSYELLTVLLALGLFLGMLVSLEMGRRLGVRWLQADPEGAHSGTGTVEGAVFALLGLLVAFTFSGAAARFDARRQLIVEEANAIGTAYLRLDTLPPEAQPGLRALFRRYVDERLAVYRALPNAEAARQELARAKGLQGELWAQAVAGTRTVGPQPAAMLLLPALNAMFDVATARTMSTQLHPSIVVYVLLFGLGLGCSVLAGYGMAKGRKRKWLHMIAFGAITALTVFVILNLEYPRLGLIRLEGFDHLLVEVRESMN